MKYLFLNFLNKFVNFIFSKEEIQQSKQKALAFKKSIFQFKKVNKNLAKARIESPVGANRKKSILKNRLKKENLTTQEATEDDFELFMNLFNSTKYTKKPG